MISFGSEWHAALPLSLLETLETAWPWAGPTLSLSFHFHVCTTGMGPLPLGSAVSEGDTLSPSVPGSWEVCREWGACPRRCGKAEVLQTGASSGALSPSFYPQVFVAQPLSFSLKQ